MSGSSSLEGQPLDVTTTPWSFIKLSATFIPGSSIHKNPLVLLTWLISPFLLKEITSFIGCFIVGVLYRLTICFPESSSLWATIVEPSAEASLPTTTVKQLSSIFSCAYIFEKLSLFHDLHYSTGGQNISQPRTTQPLTHSTLTPPPWRRGCAEGLLGTLKLVLSQTLFSRFIGEPVFFAWTGSPAGAT